MQIAVLIIQTTCPEPEKPKLPVRYGTGKKYLSRVSPEVSEAKIAVEYCRFEKPRTYIDLNVPG